MPAPARGPSPPSATIVPASMRRPAASPTRPADGDQAAPQAGAGLRAGVAVDDDLAAAHARPLAGIDAAELAPRRAAHHERAAAHPRSGPVAGVALDVQLAAAHAGPRVHPDVAGDREPPRGHARADELHAAQVALQADVVAGAGDGEELAHARALVAVPDRQRLDLVAARAGEPVGHSTSASSGTTGCSRSVSVSVMASARGDGCGAGRGCRRSCRRSRGWRPPRRRPRARGASPRAPARARARR